MFYVCPFEDGAKQVPAFILETFDAAVEAGRMDIGGPFIIDDEGERELAYYAGGHDGSTLRIVDPDRVPANYRPGGAGGHGLRPLLDPAEMRGHDVLLARIDRAEIAHDSSWKNDVSPSMEFAIGDRAYKLFIAPARTLARSYEEPFRYTILPFDDAEYPGDPAMQMEDGAFSGDVELETEDPMEVVAWFDAHDTPVDPLARRARMLELGPAKRRASDGTRESDPTVQRAKLLEMNPSRRRNPGSEDVQTAKEKFEEFHQKAPRKIFEGKKSPIPARVGELGKAKYVLYRSDKKNPETGRQEKKPVDYIHEHDAGVHCYAPGDGDVEVPDFIAKCDAFVLLGKCLGFGFVDDEGEHEAEGTNPLPDLYATPCGKALVVIQDRREVLALVWGGALNVEARGIVG